MKGPRLCLRSLSGFALLGLLTSSALLLASCEKKSMVVPGDGVVGIPSESQLIVWRDTPNEVWTFLDQEAGGPSWSSPGTGEVFQDTYLSEELVYAAGPGATRGFIFDFTPASEFEILRKNGGSFLPIFDYLLPPARRYLGFNTDVFEFSDRSPGSSPEYIGRGTASGTVVSGAPKTNIGTGGSDPLPSGITLTSVNGLDPRVPPPVDSIFRLAWSEVPNAAGYWVHVYQFAGQDSADLVATGLPSPTYLGVTQDQLIVFVPADPSADLTIVRTKYPLLTGLLYQARITAVDDSGRLIARSHKNLADLMADLTTPADWLANFEDYSLFRKEGSYSISPRGALGFQFWGRVGTGLVPLQITRTGDRELTIL
ncbi:MAG TPA: hypothetical protein VFQ05_11245 [Candidatus Eisenbacteria bacterium]|nr:hypothetical protein [Candidatus Eisenbacteria bacterium]